MSKLEQQKINLELKKNAEVLAEQVFNRLKDKKIRTDNAKYSFEVYPAKTIIEKTVDFDQRSPDTLFYKNIMIEHYESLRQDYIKQKLFNVLSTVKKTVKKKQLAH
jgi:hypothetical protein